MKKNAQVAKEEVLLTMNLIKAEGNAFVKQVMDFIEGLPYLIVCDYGHTIVENVKWKNNTINIDTGCFNTGIRKRSNYVVS